MKDRTLKKRGWSEEDIRKAKSIIKAGRRHDKSASIVNTNRVLFWTGFIIIIMGNLLISMFLIPFLIMLSEYEVNIVIIALGLMFGLLFNFIISNIEYLSKKHNYAAFVIIPATAIINFFLITRFSNSFGELLGVGIKQNPYIISLVYAAAFIFPFLVGLILKRVRT